MRAALFCAWLLVLGVGCGNALAQDTAAAEAVHRAAVFARLPPDAAQRVFGGKLTPVGGLPQAIGAYERGCLEGAVALPADGPNWQVMRPSRNRAWGHPVLISFLERLARQLPAEAGWPGLLVGDIAQPRGGPMLTGHGSHQIGLDADIWLAPMPSRRLSPAERDEISAINVVAAGGLEIDRSTWIPAHGLLLKAFAHEPTVQRIFVNAAIKRELCHEAGSDRGWLSKVRAWWGHNDHFHVRLSCPGDDPQCRNQAPPPPGDGCGKELDWWFTPEARHPPQGPAKPLLLADLPAACAKLVAAP